MNLQSKILKQWMVKSRLLVDINTVIDISKIILDDDIYS